MVTFTQTLTGGDGDPEVIDVAGTTRTMTHQGARIHLRAGAARGAVESDLTSSVAPPDKPSSSRSWVSTGDALGRSSGGAYRQTAQPG